MALFSGGSNGVNFTDPGYLGRWLVPAANLTIWDSAGTATVTTAAAFFTEIGNRGVAVDSNWTADTYKTILSSATWTQSHTLIGPTGLAGTPTTTFEITVNGVVYTIPITATTTGQRAVLGIVFQTNIASTSNQFVLGAASMDASKKVSVLGTTNVPYVRNWASIDNYGTPVLDAKISLSVRMKTSENNSTTANQERQCGIVYRTL